MNNNCCCQTTCSIPQSTGCNCDGCNKEVLNAISIVPVTTTGGSAIAFDTNRVVLGNGITHELGTGNFRITSPGTYKATFTSNARLDLGETGDKVGVVFTINEVLIPGSQVNPTLGPNDTVVLATQVVFTIQCGMEVVLRIINPVGFSTTTYVNPNSIIEKIC